MTLMVAEHSTDQFKLDVCTEFATIAPCWRFEGAGGSPPQRYRVQDGGRVVHGDRFSCWQYSRHRAGSDLVNGLIEDAHHRVTIAPIGHDTEGGKTGSSWWEPIDEQVERVQTTSPLRGTRTVTEIRKRTSRVHWDTEQDSMPFPDAEGSLYCGRALILAHELIHAYLYKISEQIVICGENQIRPELGLARRMRWGSGPEGKASCDQYAAAPLIEEEAPEDCLMFRLVADGIQALERLAVAPLRRLFRG